MSDIRQDIERVLADYCDCWSRLDFSGLGRWWDRNAAGLLYIAEEAPAPLFDFEGIEAYWCATRAATETIRIETWNLRARQLPEGLASAVYAMRWIGRFAGYAKPIGGELRVAALLRRRADGWRFTQYVEAPLAPIVYFRRAYERFAADPPPRASE